MWRKKYGSTPPNERARNQQVSRETGEERKGGREKKKLTEQNCRHFSRTSTLPAMPIMHSIKCLLGICCYYIWLFW